MTLFFCLFFSNLKTHGSMVSTVVATITFGKYHLNTLYVNIKAFPHNFLPYFQSRATTLLRINQGSIFAYPTISWIGQGICLLDIDTVTSVSFHSRISFCFIWWYLSWSWNKYKSDIVLFCHFIINVTILTIFYLHKRAKSSGKRTISPYVQINILYQTVCAFSRFF